LKPAATTRQAEVFYKPIGNILLMRFNQENDHRSHSIRQTQSVLFGHGIATINLEKTHLFTP
jgi:hypothetical protein